MAMFVVRSASPEAPLVQPEHLSLEHGPVHESGYTKASPWNQLPVGGEIKLNTFCIHQGSIAARI